MKTRRVQKSAFIFQKTSSASLFYSVHVFFFLKLNLLKLDTVGLRAQSDGRNPCLLPHVAVVTNTRIDDSGGRGWCWLPSRRVGRPPCTNGVSRPSTRPRSHNPRSRLCRLQCSLSGSGTRLPCAHERDAAIRATLLTARQYVAGCAVSHRHFISPLFSQRSSNNHFCCGPRGERH